MGSQEFLPERRAYALAEMSYQTGLSIGFLKLEIRRGELRARYFGRRVLVLREDWESYLAKRGIVDAPLRAADKA
jgi:hypothetical protein